MEHFNKLTPAKAERLACLAEEMGEVIQIIGKILRHGYESFHPKDTKRTTNRRLLEKELGDVEGIKEMMFSIDDIDEQSVSEYRDEKYGSMRKYLHHN